MAELHWFPAYVADWLGSSAISQMLPEQEGAYWRLLNLSFGKGEVEPSLPADDDLLAQMSRLGARWKKLGPLVRAQFDEREGRLYNAKLSAVWAAQTKLHDAAVAKASAGGKAKAAKEALKRATASSIGSASGDTPALLEADTEQYSGSAKLEVEAESKVWTTTTARERTVEPSDAIRLVRAANLGLLEHPTHPQRIPKIFPGQGGTLEAIEAWIAAGVDVGFAESAIYEKARTHTTEKVTTMKYFTDHVIRRWSEQVMADELANAPRPAGLPTDTPRPRITAEARQALSDRERAAEIEAVRLDREYSRLRQESVDRWSKQNTEDYEAVCASVRAEMGEVTGKFGEEVFARTVAAKLTDRVGFPSFEVWSEQRRAS